MKSITIRLGAMLIALAAAAHAKENLIAGQAIDPDRPTLLEFGMGMCAECKLMEKVLDELREKCEGQINILYVNVGETPDIGRAFGVTLIPMQVFYDAGQTERARHVGFWSATEVAAQFSAFGVRLEPSAPFSKMEAPVQTERPPAPAADVQTVGDIPADYTGVVLYLFHSEELCPCAGEIMNGAEGVAKTFFKEAMTQGRLIVRTACVADEEYAPFVEEFDLYPEYHLHNGVVLARMKDGRRIEWKKLDECDTVKHDYDQLDGYLRSEIAAFLDGIKIEGSPILLAFWMTNCAPCQRMAPVLEELKCRVYPSVRVEEIEAPPHPDAVARFGVKAVPTQILFDRHGREAARHEGFWPIEDVLTALEALPPDTGDSPPIIAKALATTSLWSRLIPAVSVPTPAEKTAGDERWPTDGYAVYYLHAAFRSGCSGDIESAAWQTINQVFKEAGIEEVPWQTLDIESEEDPVWEQTFHTDFYNYDMSRGIALVAQFRDGKPVRWTVIGDLADYRNDFDALDEYVAESMKKWLNANAPLLRKKNAWHKKQEKRNNE